MYQTEYDIRRRSWRGRGKVRLNYSCNDKLCWYSPSVHVVGSKRLNTTCNNEKFFKIKRIYIDLKEPIWAVLALWNNSEFRHSCINFYPTKLNAFCHHE